MDARNYPDYHVVSRFVDAYDKDTHGSRKDWEKTREEYAYIYAYGGVFTARTTQNHGGFAVSYETHNLAAMKRYLREVTGHPDSVFTCEPEPT